MQEFEAVTLKLENMNFNSRYRNCTHFQYAEINSFKYGSIQIYMPNYVQREATRERARERESQLTEPTSTLQNEYDSRITMQKTKDICRPPKRW